MGNLAHNAEKNGADEQPKCHGAGTALAGSKDRVAQCVTVMEGGDAKFGLDSIAHFDHGGGRLGIEVRCSLGRGSSC